MERSRPALHDAACAIHSTDEDTPASTAPGDAAAGLVSAASTVSGDAAHIHTYTQVIPPLFEEQEASVLSYYRMCSLTIECVLLL